MERPDIRTCRLPDIKRKMNTRHATTSDLALNQVRLLQLVMTPSHRQYTGRQPAQILNYEAVAVMRCVLPNDYMPQLQ